MARSSLWPQYSSFPICRVRKERRGGERKKGKKQETRRSFLFSESLALLVKKVTTVKRRRGGSRREGKKGEKKRGERGEEKISTRSFWWYLSTLFLRSAQCLVLKGEEGGRDNMMGAFCLVFSAERGRGKRGDREEKKKKKGGETRRYFLFHDPGADHAAGGEVQGRGG